MHFTGLTTYTRDLLGRVTQTRSPGDVVTTTDYDADGNVTRQTNYDVSGLSPIPSDPRTLPADRQEATVTAYDVLDRPVEVTDPAGNHTFTDYDADGEVTSQTDGMGHSTMYGYDSAGRLVTTTGPDPDDDGPLQSSVTTDKYDADNNLISQTDPLGQTTTYTYNTMNQVTSVTQPDPDGSGPLAAPVTSYEFNVDGQQTSLIDPDGNTTFSSYNSVGRLVQTVDATGGRWTYQYDGNGNLTSTTDADGRTTTYTYDSLNRVKTENWIGLDGSTVLYSIQYQYNAAGQFQSVTDPDSTDSYTYNGAGQVATVDNAGTPDVPDVLLTETYDGLGNRSSLGVSVGGISELTNTYQYDALGEMTSVTQSGSAASNKQADFAYSADGQVTEIDRYSSSNTCCPVAASTYVYNLANQLISLTHDANGTTINAYTYAYNADGQLTAMTSIDGSIAYAYDHDGQLTSSSGTGLPTGESDSYDAGGNRTNTGGATATNNQLASDGTYHYAYDADGNLITQTTIATGATENFTWDYRNRLTDVVYKNASGTTTERIHYTYDALNRRISQAIDPTGSGTYSQVEYYIYDGSNLLLTLNGSGGVTHAFLNGPATNMTLADDGVSGVSWMLADQQGTVRDVIDGSGNLLDHIQYDSYGNILSQSNPSNQPRFGYAGMMLDSSTGLYYDSARFYDPRQGRFISQDPSGFAGGNTNLYGYVNNSPTNFTDPTGLSPKYWQGWGNLAYVETGGYGWKAKFDVDYAGAQGDLQGFLNALNGVTDFVVGLENLSLRGNGYMGPPLQAPAWAQNVVYNEDPTEYAVSKFFGGNGIMLIATAGLGAFGEAGDTVETLNAAENAPLANVLEGHASGQGFTGVYDASTGKVLIQPSTAESTIPSGWVARAGGHADVSAALGGDAASHSGFAVILQDDGTLNITWRSGTLNPAPDYVVPPAARPGIIDAVQKATGRTVNP